MQRISITNPQNVIDGTAKKYYFRLRNTGGPKGDKGDKGDTGATGPQGPQGNAATVSVGSTTTLPVGYDATVTNSGSIYNAVLDFGIPQGPQGPQGAKGDKGDKGAKGDTGPRGPQGEKGTNATVYIGTTSTLAPGSQATVYNSGSDSNAVLNFGIPQGAKGDTGSQGPQGPAGQNFAPTVVAELPATGDESKLYLTPKAHTSQTATGNPITANISDGAGSMESFQLDGDTYQQTYTGKNLVNINFTDSTSNGVTKTLNADGSITLNGHTTLGHNFEIAPAVDFEIGKTYTINIEVLGGSFVPYNSNQNWAATFVYAKEGSSSLQANITENGATASYTPTSSRVSQSVRLWFGFNSQTTSELAIFNNFTFRAQIEKGSTATSYEPYVGGTASPNPDYPQAIQTVTGEQTVSINGTDYSIDLGSIELCKLGTYQDYIYKDSDDWKVHKATNKVGVSTLTGWYASGSHTIKGTWAGLNIQTLVADTGYSSHFTRAYANALYDGTTPIGFAVGSDGLYFSNNDWTLAQFTTFIGDNSVVLYGALSTPADTTITDSTLIAQLEAIRTASLENGTNTITNTATGSNLAGDMEISYYGYNPTNRYDKFIWLDLNNNYEQIGE